jgi:hypothetical protein
MGSTSNENLLKAINSINKVQGKILENNKNLTASQSTQFADPRNDFQGLFNQVSSLKAENIALLKEIDSLRNRVIVLETTNVSSSNTDSLPILITEMAEREKCSQNFIVHGLNESSSLIPAEKNAYSLDQLNKITQSFSISLPTNLKLIRLGHINDNRPRPLKVILTSKDITLRVIADFNFGKRSCNPKKSYVVNIILLGSYIT